MALDYYAVLGVKKNASADELRKAYKKLSRENHPDRKPNDASASEKFKQVQEAWDVLGDATKRQQYDQFGSAFGPNGPQFQQGQRRGGAGPVDFQEMFGGNVDLSDLLGGMFGGGAGGSPFGQQAGRRGRAAQGANIEAEIEIPFVVATEGGMQDLQLDSAGKHERLSVKIPPGVSTGSVIRLAGQGQAGRGGGPAGDLLVTIKVASHSYFRREGSDLLIDVPLTVSEAALGTKVEIPTLAEGPMVVTIPPGTSSGAKLRLRGKGVPDQKTRARGDLYVVIKLVLPPKLDDATRRLFEQIAAAAPYNPRAGLW
ncbi:MAG: J domain-containing protein [Planctomycetota bacterium]|nr:MAG: J domain-containing protein [Planctomycetota bacterium]